MTDLTTPKLISTSIIPTGSLTWLVRACEGGSGDPAHHPEEENFLVEEPVIAWQLELVEYPNGYRTHKPKPITEVHDGEYPYLLKHADGSYSEEGIKVAFKNDVEVLEYLVGRGKPRIRKESAA